MIKVERPTPTPYNLTDQQSRSSDLTQSPSYSDDEGRLKFSLPGGTTQETILLPSPDARDGQNAIGAQKEGEGAGTAARDAVGGGRSLHRHTEALNNVTTTAMGIQANTAEAHKRRQSQVEEMAAQGSERKDFEILYTKNTRAYFFA